MDLMEEKSLSKAAVGEKAAHSTNTSAEVHLPIGYLDPVHLAPAIAGAALFATGIICQRR
jgi:hypothetical protein